MSWNRDHKESPTSNGTGRPWEVMTANEKKKNNEEEVIENLFTTFYWVNSQSYCSSTIIQFKMVFRTMARESCGRLLKQGTIFGNVLCWSPWTELKWPSIASMLKNKSRNLFIAYGGGALMLNKVGDDRCCFLLRGFASIWMTEG